MRLQLFEKYERLIGVPTPQGARDELIQARIFDHIETAPIVALANSLFSILLGLIFWGQLSPWFILPWCAVMQLAAFVQLRMWSRNRYKRDKRRHPKRVVNIQINTIIVSCLWSSFGCQGILYGDAISMIQLAVIASVIIAGAVVLFALMPCCSMILYVIFAIPMLALLVYRFEEAALTNAIVTIVLTFVNGLVARVQFVRGLEIFMKNRDLVRLSMRLENQAELRARMLADTSHELRTPLNAIIGFSEMINHRIMGEVQPAKYGEYVQDIHQSASHLLDVINDILDLSKLESGADALQIEHNIDLNALLGRCLTMTEKLYGERGVSVAMDPIPRPILLSTDARRMTQVLMNLLSNAAKYTDQGGHVAVGIEIDNADNLVITIADNGYGMSDREIDEALRPFGRTSSSDQSGSAGHGLGLPIVSHLLKLHGGALKIESRKGVGTRMKVVLPPKCWDYVSEPPEVLPLAG